MFGCTFTQVKSPFVYPGRNGHDLAPLREFLLNRLAPGELCSDLRKYAQWISSGKSRGQPNVGTRAVCRVCRNGRAPLVCVKCTEKLGQLSLPQSNGKWTNKQVYALVVRPRSMRRFARIEGTSFYIYLNDWIERNISYIGGQFAVLQLRLVCAHASFPRETTCRGCECLFLGAVAHSDRGLLCARPAKKPTRSVARSTFS